VVSEALPSLPLDPQAKASSPSAALPAPLRSVRRSRFEESNQSEPPTNTPFASPREAQSSGAQCEGGLADARGFTIAFDIVRLLQTAHSPRSISQRICRKKQNVKSPSATIPFSGGTSGLS